MALPAVLGATATAVLGTVFSAAASTALSGGKFFVGAVSSRKAADRATRQVAGIIGAGLLAWWAVGQTKAYRAFAGSTLASDLAAGAGAAAAAVGSLTEATVAAYDAAMSPDNMVGQVAAGLSSWVTDTLWVLFGDGWREVQVNALIEQRRQMQMRGEDVPAWMDQTIEEYLDEMWGR